jgi:hypothetical protein
MDFDQIINHFQRNFVRDGMDAQTVKEAFGEAQAHRLDYLIDLYGTYRESSSFYKSRDLEALKDYSVPDPIVTFYRYF